jgi:hypothetical protein
VPHVPLHARPILLALSIAAGLGGASAANADALISRDLQSRLLLPGTHQVIVTWTDPAVATKLRTISTSVRTLSQLPMSARCSPARRSSRSPRGPAWRASTGTRR